MNDEDPLGLIGSAPLEGKYEFEKLVGEGGFALVYRARHLLWKLPVAIKVFAAVERMKLADREAMVADFIREGALLAKLSERSSAICQARDMGLLKTSRGTNCRTWCSSGWRDVIWRA